MGARNAVHGSGAKPSAHKLIEQSAERGTSLSAVRRRSRCVREHVTAPEQVDEMRAAVITVPARRRPRHRMVVGAAGAGRRRQLPRRARRTPLHWAVERGDEHFDALLDADATLDLADDRGRTLRDAGQIVGDVHNQFIRRLLDAAGELGTLKLVNAAGRRRRHRADARHRRAERPRDAAT